MKRALPAAVLALLLAGCATTGLEPVRVVTTEPGLVQVRWNGVEASEAVARSAAVLHCAPYRIEEVDAHSRGGLGLVRSRTWRCVGA